MTIFPSPSHRTNPKIAGGACTLFLISTAVFLPAAEIVPRTVLDTNFQTRVGYDSNPTGRGGTAAAAQGGDDTSLYAVGGSLSLLLPTANQADHSLKLNYAAEAMRFGDFSSENFVTHRFGGNGQCSAAGWKFSGEGSTLFVAGSRDTLPSDAATNANAISLWRERRRQWQHRLRVQAQGSVGACFVRATGTLLAYDYETKAVLGKVPFADRSDLQGVVELGWKQSEKSLWLTGVRVGHQHQAIVPLPNCEFDYTNDYRRLTAGWEGRPSANTKVAFAAGPDFRHYSGAIDPRIFLGGRDRTSLWFEGSFSAKLCPTLTLTGKAARMDWLSSTGKSAYIDTSAETAATWAATPGWTLRLSAKVHRCDYFPAVRDDWEALLGVGCTLKIAERARVTIDLLRHSGWNYLASPIGREFQRVTVAFGLSVDF